MINDILKFFVKDEHGLYGYHRLFNTIEYRQHLMDIRNRERAIKISRDLLPFRSYIFMTNAENEAKALKDVKNLNDI